MLYVTILHTLKVHINRIKQNQNNDIILILKSLWRLKL